MPVFPKTGTEKCQLATLGGRWKSSAFISKAERSNLLPSQPCMQISLFMQKKRLTVRASTYLQSVFDMVAKRYSTKDFLNYEAQWFQAFSVGHRLLYRAVTMVWAMMAKRQERMAPPKIREKTRTLLQDLPEISFDHLCCFQCTNVKAPGSANDISFLFPR